MMFETMKIANLISEISMGPFGSNIKVECFVDEGIPVLNGSNLEGFALKEDAFRYVTKEKADSLGKANAHRGDVVITHRGTLGQIVFIPDNSKYERYVISQSQFRVKCNEKILPEYLVYYFHTRIGQHKLLSNASQVGVPALARASTTFQTIEIEVPGIDIQHNIVDLLETIRKKIELNNAINDNLHQQCVILVDHLLSELTEFETLPLSKVADCQNGRAFYKEGYDEEGAFVIDLGNVNTSGNFIYTNADKYVSLARYNDPKLERYRVYQNDLVMVMTDRKSTMELLGKTGKIYKPGYYLLNQRMYRIRAKQGMNTNYLYACLNSTDVCNSLKEKALGSVQKYVNTGEINSIQIKVPTSDKMEEIGNILDPIFLQMETNILENESLIQMRDTLLPKLMSGELDVSELDL
ncbi:MAG: restriction endonuclease subunit S [Lachnospiraceae bacterium]|nr:restriction endonuclease subunit S [Lachnospiraceae bacterium]